MKYLAFVVFIVFTTFIVTPIYAQANLTNVFDISDPDAKDGDILIFDPTEGIQRANSVADSHLFGVLEDQPGVVFKERTGTKKSVVRQGIAKVNITLSNGSIKKGDGITSSTEPGLGMKATSPGYIIGTALEDANEAAAQIDVAVDVNYKDFTTPTGSIVNKLLDSVLKSFLKSSENDQGFQQIIKYLLAALIILIAVIFGLFIINRSMPKAIEAIGRNPLAKRSIEFSLILNILIVVAVVAGSIVAAIIILRL